MGFRYQCNCCGWRLRAFVERGSFFGNSHDAYCPRCNAKARHRGLWLFLAQSGLLGTNRTRLLHVAPWPKIAELIKRLSNVEYVSVDLTSSEHVTIQADITSLPMTDDSFDAAICIHVLEHVPDDRSAISELHRVLKPGGWALVSVPIRMDQPTFEDSSITDPNERKRFFGERVHVRYYGYDFADRLEQAGFKPTVHKGVDFTEDQRYLHGLRDDEDIYVCRKDNQHE